jgi:hypothetical protein
MNQEKYIGMDVHQATISVAAMDGSGKIIYLLKPHVSHLVVCDPRKNALLKDGSKSAGWTFSANVYVNESRHDSRARWRPARSPFTTTFEASTSQHFASLYRIRSPDTPKPLDFTFPGLATSPDRSTRNCPKSRIRYFRDFVRSN